VFNITISLDGDGELMGVKTAMPVGVGGRGTFPNSATVSANVPIQFSKIPCD
jgi:hypothetical protein